MNGWRERGEEGRGGGVKREGVRRRGWGARREEDMVKYYTIGPSNQ